MARTCSICSHPQIEAINKALVSGASIRATGTKWHVGRSALGRHKAKHLPATMVQATAAAEVVAADGLLDCIRFLESEALAILAKERGEDGDHRVALTAIRVGLAATELRGKVAGELGSGGVAIGADDATDQTFNLIIGSPQSEGADEGEGEDADLPH